MVWPDREKIKDGVLSMLRVNMALREGERLLVVTDPPRLSQWPDRPAEELMKALRRSILARMVAEIAAQGYPNCPVEFYAYPSVGMSGAEPGDEVRERMCQAEVVIAITNYSLSHTDAREAATRKGVRIASMPGFVAEMFSPGGPMTADYRRVAAEGKRMASLMTAAKSAAVRSSAGTDISFSLLGRSGLVDDGLYTTRGAWGNLPGGEAYTAPVEGTAKGVIVVQRGWYPDLTEEMSLHFEEGMVIDVQGGGAVGDRYRRLLQVGNDEEVYRARRNLAELGVGVNPNAKRPDNLLEAEKIKGTVHLAIGDNSHMGGTVTADLHHDFVIPEPDLILDGEVVIRAGQWMI